MQSFTGHMKDSVWILSLKDVKQETDGIKFALLKYFLMAPRRMDQKLEVENYCRSAGNSGMMGEMAKIGQI